MNGGFTVRESRLSGRRYDGFRNYLVELAGEPVYWTTSRDEHAALQEFAGRLAQVLNPDYEDY